MAEALHGLKKAWNRNKKAKAVKKSVITSGKVAVAGFIAGVLSIWNAGRKAIDGVSTFTENKFKKSKGETKMKKSTFVTILVVLAAVAGALGALYLYVLRREKELDEYEQLLFSEDFNDEVPADFLNDSDNTESSDEKDDTKTDK